MKFLITISLLLISYTSNAKTSYCSYNPRVVKKIIDHTDSGDCFLLNSIIPVMEEINDFLPEHPGAVTVQIHPWLRVPGMGLDGYLYIGHKYRIQRFVIPAMETRETLWAHEYAHHYFNFYMQKNLESVSQYIALFSRGATLSREIDELLEKDEEKFSDLIDEKEREFDLLEGKINDETIRVKSLLGPFSELLADVVAVMFTHDPSSVARARVELGGKDDHSRDFASHNEKDIRISAHNVLDPTRRYIWENFGGDNGMMLENKKEFISKLMIAIKKALAEIIENKEINSIHEHSKELNNILVSHLK